MHYLEPFVLDLDLDPDQNEADLEAIVQANFDRQRVIEAFLKGEVSLYDLLDSVADVGGIDAYEYLELVNANIDHIVGTQLPVIGTSQLFSGS